MPLDVEQAEHFARYESLMDWLAGWATDARDRALTAREQQLLDAWDAYVVAAEGRD